MKDRQYYFKDDFHRLRQWKYDSFSEWMLELNEMGAELQIGLIEQKLEVDAFIEQLKRSANPIIVFIKEGEELLPVIIKKDRKFANEFFKVTPSGDRLVELEVDNLVDFAAKLLKIKDLVHQYGYFSEYILTGPDDSKIFVVSSFVNVPLVSDKDEFKNFSELAKPVRRLFRVLASEKKDIFNIYLYAILIGILGLTLPLGIQSIINFISGGVIFDSVTLLISIVIFGLVFSGVLQVMQLILVEMIQRRIFTRVAFEFALTVPKIKTESLLKDYPPELINRFFDVMTLTKSLPKLIIDLATNILQIFFGILLLTAYHPSFILLGLGLFTLLIIVIYYFAPGGLRTSLVTSKYKYKLVYWLEEIARNAATFKVAGFTNHPLDKTDSITHDYLVARDKHFKILVNQFISIIGFKVLIIGGMLIIGSNLVVARQISLGQFVASEIVIILIINSVEKLILSLETVYEALTSVEKIAQVTDLDTEEIRGLNISLPKKPMEIALKNLTYSYPGNAFKTLSDLSFTIPAGSVTCIAGFSRAGRVTLVKVICGLLHDFKGAVNINNLSLRDLEISSYRFKIAANLKSEDIFDGTIEENITLGRADISIENVMDVLDIIGMKSFVSQLPQGFKSQIQGGNISLSDKDVTRLLLARNLVGNPNIVFLEDVFSNFDRSEKYSVIRKIIQFSRPNTLILLSNDPEVMKMANQVLLLENGSLAFDGDFETFEKSSLFQKLNK